MKKLSGVLSLLAFLFLLPLCANATTVDFYSDGTITDGDSYTTVNIWDTATVDMTGGAVSNCNLYDTSAFNCYDGTLHFLYINDNAVATISNIDYIASIQLHENSKLYMYDGGSASSISMQIFDNAELHIYGTSLTLIMPTSSGTSGAITGYWADGQKFTIGFRNAGDFDISTQVFLHEIPEPSTLSLLSLFAFFLRGKTKKN